MAFVLSSSRVESVSGTKLSEVLEDEGLDRSAAKSVEPRVLTESTSLEEELEARREEDAIGCISQWCGGGGWWVQRPVVRWWMVPIAEAPEHSLS